MYKIYKNNNKVHYIETAIQHFEFLFGFKQTCFE